MANQQQSSTTDAAALEYAGDTYLNVYLDDTKKLRIVRKTWEMPPGRTTYITRAKKGNSSRWWVFTEHANSCTEHAKPSHDH